MDRPAPSRAAELGALVRELGLPSTAVEDALAPFERPKVSRHEGYLFFTVYATRLRPHDHLDPTKGRLVLGRLSAIMTPHALVTIRLDDEIDLAPIMKVWQDNADLLVHGAGALVHGLLDVIVDGHFDTIQALDEETESLEDVLFAEGSPQAAGFIRRIYGLRKDLVALRRTVLPMREVVNGVQRHRTGKRTELDSWFDDLYDHALRAGEWSESLRDMVTTMFEAHLSLQDSRLNQIMKKLAGWAAIIAVPTAITGWFGQNVPYWGFNQPWGVLLSLGMILVASVTLYVVFRFNDWV
ncbi:magnesium transporter CorA family protein [Raineyella fluvialis]|uniref:magnesium transporter CorA family protein n=1 Tax=Raineyella fluvialis TaxID=2662261 RepID=UPI0024114F8B|nr:magnesium transporter CorA family protein [Raineyella fluvialis]